MTRDLLPTSFQLASDLLPIFCLCVFKKIRSTQERVRSACLFIVLKHRKKLGRSSTSYSLEQAATKSQRSKAKTSLRRGLSPLIDGSGTPSGGQHWSEARLVKYFYPEVKYFCVRPCNNNNCGAATTR